jgi:hypothetical protein
VDFTKIRVTQSLEIIVGEQTRLYDTVLVKYRIENGDDKEHVVGLRIMVDTFIGSNDGVPFFIPPAEKQPAKWVDKMEVTRTIPQFIHALESADLSDKTNTVALFGLKVKGSEPIEKLVICRWPQNSEARWGGGNGPGQWKYEPMDLNPNAKDSCVVLYWAQTKIKPGETRELAFTYGLGRILGDGNAGAVGQGGKMRLFTSPGVVNDKPFIIVAYIKGNANQKVTLKLPAALTLAEGEKADQATPQPTGEGYSQVTWRVKGAKPGKYTIEAEAPGIGNAKEIVELRPTSLFE